MRYKPRDIDKDGEYDNTDSVERIQAGMGNFSNYRDEFFQPVDKDYDRMTGLQTGIVADQIGKDMDMARSEQQAEPLPPRQRRQLPGHRRKRLQRHTWRALRLLRPGS